MKLNNLTLNELYSLYKLTEGYKHHLERIMRLPEGNNNTTIQKNQAVFTKLKMIYEEINKRLKEIES